MKAFSKENFNLKSLLVLFACFNLISLVTVLVVVKRGPKVIALESSGLPVSLETKITDLQIEAAAREYLKYRYSWTAESVSSQLDRAKFFVEPSLVPSFERSMLETKKYVREKKVTQRVYPRSIRVDLKEKKIFILSDRFTEFDQLKAATEMKLTLQFVIDDRSVVNPWGVYITKESEEAMP